MKYLILFLLPILAHADILAEPSPIPSPIAVARPTVAAKNYVVSALSGSARFALKNLKDVELFMLKQIQTNPDGLTPQQVFDSFGADQCQAYGFVNVTMTYLNAIKAATVPAWTISVTKAGVGAACTITVN